MERFQFCMLSYETLASEAMPSFRHIAIRRDRVLVDEQGGDLSADKSL